MNSKIEEMRKQLEEIRQKNDGFLAARIAGYDPEKAKSAREKLLKAMQKK